MQIPLLQGSFTDENADVRTAYPINMIPVPKVSGVSDGYFRPADGAIQFDDIPPGNDRGAFNWNDVCYRVSGDQLIEVSETGAVTLIDSVEDDTRQCTLTNSFDYLAIASNQKLWLFDGVTVTQNIDPDLGPVLDVIFVDGYFMTTDGEFLVVTELGDPFSVNPLKYGSSELDPDPVIGLAKLRNQAYALNTYTIEVFENVGGTGFPFRRINGAQIPRGVVGTHAHAIFMEQIAFVGGGRNEAPGVWLARAGQSVKLSTREIDQMLLRYPIDCRTRFVCEVRVDKGHELLYIHLPDQTICYDGRASQVAGQPIWFILKGPTEDWYPVRNFIRIHDKWFVGDPTSPRLGYWCNEVATLYGDTINWQFLTLIMYNDAKGALVHMLELVGVTGRAAFGSDPKVYTSFSTDGLTFTNPVAMPVGTAGATDTRVAWWEQGYMNFRRIQKFEGTSDAMFSIIRLEANIEGLNV